MCVCEIVNLLWMTLNLTSIFKMYNWPSSIPCELVPLGCSETYSISHTRTHTSHTPTYTRTNTHTQAHTHTHTHTQVHTHTHTHSQTHTHIPEMPYFNVYT